MSGYRWERVADNFQVGLPQTRPAGKAPWFPVTGAKLEQVDIRELLQWVLPMTLPVRPIHQETVMCTVQGCLHTAAFMFTGGIDSVTGSSVLAAYCEHHAEEAATRLRYPWPITERRQPDRVVPARSFRAG